MHGNILVTGGRNYHNRNKVFQILYQICDDKGWNTEPDRYGNSLPNVTIIHGACPTGADRWADEFAIVHWTNIQTFSPDWDLHGKAAGPLRNQEMVDYLIERQGPHLVVAFPGGKGTADCVKRAKRAKIEVIEVEQ